MITKSALASPLGGVLLLIAGCGPQPEPPVTPKEPSPPVASATPAGCTEKSCGAGLACVAGECRAPRSIAAVGGVVCAVTAGKVACWGDNGRGVIDGGSKGARATPVVVPGLTDATMVRVGPRFGCAVTAAGKVACFREGAVRELSLLSDVTSLAIKDEVVLALKKSGEVVGVSLGRSGKDMEPVELPKLADVTEVAAGDDHACVTHKNGEVSCWGSPSKTGSGKDVSDLGWEAREAMAKEPIHPQGLKDVAQISASDTHTCAVLTSKKVMCWGENWSGELGDGTSDRRYAPVAVQLLDDAVEVVAGHHHTCARRAAGKVVCWGAGSAGQLGAGSASVRGMVEARDVGDAEALAAGEEVSCAARAGGAISCWGSASRGRLGNGAVSDDPTPHLVKGVSGAAHLALGEGVSCALNGQKQLQCWGFPGFRSDDDKEKRAFTPTPVAWIGEVTSVAMNDSGLCAVDKANALFCGYASALLKGNNVKPMDLKGTKIVHTTGSSGVGVLTSGQVFLWSDPSQIQKLNVNGLADAVSVSATGSKVCAVRRSGKVACAGYSYRTFDKKEPIKPTAVVEVPDIKDAVQIVGDMGTMCALRKSGEVSCFSTYRIPSPVDPKAKKEKETKPKEKEKPRPIEVKVVEGLSDATTLVGANSVFCAVKKDATAACWGWNKHGELGRGDYSDAESPTPVPGLTDVADIAVGNGQTCAAKKNGEVLCWGKNYSDQAGQPGASFARSPAPVLTPGAAQ